MNVKMDDEIRLSDVEELLAMRRALLSNAAMFDDPRAYAAGVEDALDAYAEVIGLDEVAEVTRTDPDDALREVGIGSEYWIG